MSRKDPFSTPARRRRIIADVAILELRLYCQTACANVSKFRRETAASLKIQCFLRCIFACDVLRLLRLRRLNVNATIIQSIWRMKFARMLKTQLNAQHRLRYATKLALNLQAVWYNRKEKLHRLAVRIAMQLALEKRRNLAASRIQKEFRDSIARTKAYQLVAALRNLRSRRKKAVLIVQCSVRQYFARGIATVRRLKRILGKLRQLRVMYAWKRMRVKQFTSARLIQCAFRVCSARVRVSNIRYALEQMRLDKVSEPRPVSPSPAQKPLPRLPATKTTTIQVELATEVLAQLAVSGPCAVLDWGLTNNLLHYSSTTGYSLGSVVRQVMNSVEEVMQQHSETSETNDNTTQSTAPSHTKDVMTNNADEKVITLSQWDEGSESDTPVETHLPVQWQEAFYAPLGAEIAFSLFANKIELNVLLEHPPLLPPIPHALGVQTEINAQEFQHDSLIYHCLSKLPVVAPPPSTTLITILLVMDDDISDNSDNTGNTVMLTNSEQLQCYLSTIADHVMNRSSKSGIDEAKFRFKNALVQVSSAPSSQVPEIESMPQTDKALVNKDETENDEVIVPLTTIKDDPPIPPISSPTPLPRPRTAVMRVVLREPSPPPIDYDIMAKRIQNLVRYRLERIQIAATIIQEYCKLCYRYHNWRILTAALLIRAHEGATAIQCLIRCFIAKCKLARLRKDFVFGHDFLVSERDNWKAFGIFQVCADDMFPNEMLLPCPITADFVSNKRNTSIDTTTDKDTPQLLNNPVGAIIDLTQLPGPGTGCLPLAVGGGRDEQLMLSRHDDVEITPDAGIHLGAIRQFVHFRNAGEHNVSSVDMRSELKDQIESIQSICTQVTERSIHENSAVCNVTDDGTLNVSCNINGSHCSGLGNIYLSRLSSMPYSESSSFGWCFESSMDRLYPNVSTRSDEAMNNSNDGQQTSIVMSPAYLRLAHKYC